MHTESHRAIWVLVLVLAPFVLSTLLWAIDDLVSRARSSKARRKNA